MRSSYQEARARSRAAKAIWRKLVMTSPGRGDTESGLGAGAGDGDLQMGAHLGGTEECGKGSGLRQSQSGLLVKVANGG